MPAPRLSTLLARLGWWAAGPLLLLVAVLVLLRLHQIDDATTALAREVAADSARTLEHSLLARIRALDMLARGGDPQDPAHRALLQHQALAFQAAYGHHVMLAVPGGKVLLNTRAAPGAAPVTLPPLNDRERLLARLSRGEPAVTDLVIGRLARQSLVAVVVPVMQAGQLTAFWIAQYEATDFEQLLHERPLPAGWRLVLQDSTGAMIASRGQPPAQAGEPGRLQTTQALHTAPWRVVVELPPAVALGATHEAIALLLLAALLATLAGVLGGRLTSRRIEAALRALTADAQARPADRPAIHEIREVQQRLAQAARERDLADSALRERERAYRLMFDHHPQPMWVYDEQTLRFLAVNDAAVAAYGHSREAFLAMTIADIRPPEELPRMHALLAALAEGSTELARTTKIWRHRRKDGQDLIVEINSRAIHTDGLSGRLVMAQDITERVRAEQALRASERDFRVLAEQVPAIVYRARLDPPGQTDYVSPRIAELGHTPEAWLAQPDLLWQAMHPDDLPRVLRELSSVWQGSSDELHLEYRIRNAAGRWRHASDHLRVVRPTDGSPPFILGVNVDVSRQREAELALRRSELMFRTLAEQLPAIVYRTPAEGRGPATYISPGIALFGYTPEAFAGPGALSWWDLMHPEDQPQTAAVVAAGNAAPVPRTVQLEYRLRDHAGQWRHVIDYARIGPDPDGAPQIQGVVVETTALKRTEQALRAAEAYQRSLFDALAEGVVLIDRSGRVLDANPAAGAMLGRPRDDLLARSLSSFLAPEDDLLLRQLAGDLPGGEHPALMAWTPRRRDGSRFPAEVSARAVDAERRVLVLRDISEREATQRALLNHQLELSQLAQQLMAQERTTTRHLAQALHDRLGQSLAVARLNLDTTFLLLRDLLPTAVKPACQRVSDAVDQAIAEVRQVLVELRPPLLEQRGLHAALDNEVRSRSSEGSGVDVLLEADDGLVDLRWPFEVEYGTFMVAREAIVNAMRHARASLVRVIVEGTATSLRLAVQDDGRGIPPDLHEGRPGHLGLVGMRERALAIGARFSIQPDPDGGTCVLLHWPAETP